MNLTLVGYRLAATVLPHLPVPLAWILAETSGWAAWATAAGARGSVKANLRVVLGVEPTGAQVRDVFRTAAQNYVDLFALPRVVSSDLLSRIDVEGWEHLEAALGEGRGAILASLHLGNLEIVGCAAHGRGLTVMLPVEALEPPELLELMLRLRRRAHLICEPVGHDAFDQIRLVLRQNGIVGVAADRVAVGTGEVVTFCGYPARLPVAAGLLAVRTRAPVLAIGSQRLPGGRYRIRISRPLPISTGPTARETVRRTTERILQELEVFLRANPTQWVMFRPIWDAPSGA